MFEDLHYRSAHYLREGLAYISMDNRWSVGVEVLETLCNIKHEAELIISILLIFVATRAGTHKSLQCWTIDIPLFRQRRSRNSRGTHDIIKQITILT
jgi:hypothetical protein